MNKLPAMPPMPCTKDCPKRNATCHGRCKGYLKYEKWKRMYYDLKLQESKNREASHGQATREAERTRAKWQSHNYKYKN